jgi:hypothetical protein
LSDLKRVGEFPTVADDPGQQPGHRQRWVRLAELSSNPVTKACMGHEDSLSRTENSFTNVHDLFNK